MSHPAINRWGNNLFWYHMWYSDKNKHFNIHKDSLFNELIYIYLNYGLFFKKNFFLNTYWYNENFINKNTFLSINDEMDNKCFQITQHKNKLTDSISYTKSRIQIKHFYQSKLWIFTTNNWIVFNLYAYQPTIKKQKKRFKKTIKTFSLIKKNFIDKNNLLLIRFKLFFFFFTKKFSNTNFYYHF